MNKQKENSKSTKVKLFTSSNGRCDEIRNNKNLFEIIYIKKRAIEYPLDSKNEKTTVGSGQNAVLICPYSQYHFANEKECDYRNILIEPELIQKACDFIDSAFYNKIVLDKIMSFTLTDDDIIFFERQFLLLLSDTNSDEKRKNYEKLIVAQFIGFLYMEEQTKTNSMDFKSKCLLSINSHCIDSNAIDFLRIDCGYNKIYLCKKFKKEFGTTISAYILSLRLNHAAFLLKTTSYSLEECTHAVGLESVTYFINAFKKKYGVTPAKYRKSVREK